MVTNNMKRLTVLMLVIAALVAMGCGPKAAPSTSVLDTPEYHYNQGLKFLDKDQIDDTIQKFQQAINLDPKSPLGYIGKGLALGKKGDFKPAFENMEKAKDLEKKGIEARIGMIRLHSLQRGKNFVKECESEFKAANEKEPNSARLHYFMGMAYKSALDFDKAASMFRTVLDLNKDFTGEAKLNGR
jgi:tetratricopeptide (TPR) repeat protein